MTFDDGTVEVPVSVPEPASLPLLASSLFALAGVLRWQNKRGQGAAVPSHLPFPFGERVLKNSLAGHHTLVSERPVDFIDP